MTKTRLLETLRSDRARWDALLEEIGEERMTQPGVMGEWSVKDLIAHVTWYEREIVGVLKARKLAGSDLWDLPHDRRNSAIYEENKDRALADVLAEARRVYRQFAALLEFITDEDLTDSGRFAEMPSEWQPWKLIAENSYEHYHQHMPHIRAWLDKPGD